MVQSLDVAYLSIAELGALYRSRELSPVEVARQLLDRAASVQDRIHAFITPTPELALEQARVAEAAFLAGEASSPLLGVPVGFKDIVTTAGIRTTCGSAVHLDWVPETDAAVVERWRAAGTVMLGKLATSEFAMGTQPPGHPILAARNPWNPAHSPGGSSSGSGAALAAGLVAGAIGTDTGGSIRGPAAYCGISGLKPTYGRISRRGIVTLSWSLDHAGPMGRSAEDVACLLGPLAGYDAGDPASAHAPLEDYVAGLGRGVAGLRIGIARNLFDFAETEEIAATDQAADVFANLGADLIEVTFPSLDLTAAGRAIMLPEAYAYHARDLTETPEKYPTQLEHRLKAGGLIFADEYVQAQRVRSMVRDQVAELYKGIDLLLCPTMRGEAPTYEESLTDAWVRTRGVTNVFNFTGQPALAFPAGFSEHGLPLSIQLAGRPFAEATVLAAAHAYQTVTDWHRRHPSL
jgi:aspartyl-tRNA(Asn)/glutamyl-tRNA(Gln) amidotransferase subunit A